jgi:hypothetical protein
MHRTDWHTSFQQVNLMVPLADPASRIKKDPDPGTKKKAPDPGSATLL